MEIELNSAQSRLQELGELAWEGEEIVITRKGKPYLLLVAHLEEDDRGISEYPQTKIDGRTEG